MTSLKCIFARASPFTLNVDLPVWMVSRLDKEAKRLGVPRQSLIKVWIAEKLQSLQF